MPVCMNRILTIDLQTLCCGTPRHLESLREIMEVTRSSMLCDIISSMSDKYIKKMVTCAAHLNALFDGDFIASNNNRRLELSPDMLAMELLPGGQYILFVHHNSPPSHETYKFDFTCSSFEVYTCGTLVKWASFWLPCRGNI